MRAISKNMEHSLHHKTEFCILNVTHLDKRDVPIDLSCQQKDMIFLAVL